MSVQDTVILQAESPGLVAPVLASQRSEAPAAAVSDTIREAALTSGPREALADTDTSHWWTYRLPRQLECRFVEETDADRNRQIRLWFGVCLAFSWVTCAIDLVMVPDMWLLAVSLRLGVVTPVSLSAIWLLSQARPRSWQTTLASVAPLAVDHLSGLTVLGASATVDTFRSAIVLCIGLLWMNVLVPLRFHDTLVFSATTLALGDAINLASASWHNAAIGNPETVVVCHVLVVMSFLVRFLAERQSRQSFVLGLRLRLRAEDLMRSNEQLRELSDTDPLTGLANRRCFERALSHAWLAATAERSSLAAMMIDVDHFKLFNDVAGHLEGDRCLFTVSRTIAGQMRRGQDIAARFGGEEFIVLMPNTRDDEAFGLAERIRAAIAAQRMFHPGRIGHGSVSVSIGVAAMCPAAPGAEPAGLIAAADGAMYTAKLAGRDRVMDSKRPNFHAQPVS